ncbi:aspartate-semialdehyde dehydrogenase [Pseudomonas sp. QL9]|uniref:aspartate-semialdehyde dehydrogenase n=1 Tax=Pseudomonas sp. QL9 TaxID=3242725 RepID=UPI00352A7421
MFPPITPNLQPVTAQQDPVRSRPEVAPVTPVEPAAGDDAVALEKRPAEQTQDEGYSRRRRRPPQTAAEAEEARAEEADGTLLPDGQEAPPRKGQWIDIEV